jgi:hypothetical protein
MDVDHWQGCTSAPKLDFAVQVLLRYKLMDILANVLDCQRHPNRRVTPQSALPHLPQRMEQVRYLIVCQNFKIFTLCHQLRHSISNWPSIVEKFRPIFAKGPGQGTGSPASQLFNPPSSAGPSTLSAHAQVLKTGLTSLVSASRHMQDASYHKIMINIQLLVFSMCWFGMVRPLAT